MQQPLVRPGLAVSAVVMVVILVICPQTLWSATTAELGGHKKSAEHTSGPLMLTPGHKHHNNHRTFIDNNVDEFWKRPPKAKSAPYRAHISTIKSSFQSPEDCGFIQMASRRILRLKSGKTKKKNGSSHRLSSGLSVRSTSQWPFFGTLMGGSYSDDAIVCGATIISPELVITSATCGLNISTNASPKSLRLIVGSHHRSGSKFQGQVVWARDSCAPANYKIRPSINGSSRSEYDFLIIQLDDKLNMTANISSACVGKPKIPVASLVSAPEEIKCVAIGHERLNAGGELTVKYTPIEYIKCWSQDESQFCFKSSDASVNTCLNDSGGPILCRSSLYERWYLVGLISTVLASCENHPADWGIYNVATDINKMLEIGTFKECINRLNATN